MRRALPFLAALTFLLAGCSDDEPKNTVSAGDDAPVSITGPVDLGDDTTTTDGDTTTTTDRTDVDGDGEGHDGGGEEGGQNDALSEAKSLWQYAGPSSYTVVVERLCFCPEDYRGPYLVTVVDGEVTDVAFTNPALTTPVPDEVGDLSIDGLFDIIEDAVDRGAAEVSVTYDTDRGYPVSISIDYEELMADDEVGFTITELTPSGGTPEN